MIVTVLGARWRVPVAGDGTFEIEGLPPIEVVLRPERQVRPNYTQGGARVTVQPGSTPVLQVPGS